MNILTLLIIAHLCGDFLLQNHWMQRKAQSTYVCAVHVAAYSVPFLGLWCSGALAPLVLVLILAEHFLQDRFQLHLKWMRVFEQTPSEQWPTGPLCVDQAMHITCIGILSVFLS